MKNHHKAFKAAVIVLASFFLFIAPVHDAMIQTPAVEIYLAIDGHIDSDAITADEETVTCSEFVCSSIEGLLFILADEKP